ncbi:hypothetical protein [Nocardioides piscis]|uniref:Uncharacterized protein n=1 Tax=Nocardioides piscis TaxID=2714938 RepID=A0A6G7YBU5_9ACTN|nr:hypothetical protein [Nocardioides piscis]QIK74292.1 hypothetical protein G7071_01400 [Nocardioides piscis]
MEWTRSKTFRGFVIALLAIFLVIQVAQRDWPWVGVMTALLVANIASWRAQQNRSLQPRAPAVPKGALVPPGVDVTLRELLDRPAVRQAWSTAPVVWQQVSYLDDEENLSLTADEVANFVWVSTHDVGPSQTQSAHWSVGIGDELKPVLDLDVPEDEDALTATLADSPAVGEVAHMDREDYEVTLAAPMTLDEIAALAAQGLIAHHLDAVRRLRPATDDQLSE